jgi:putative DNA methylase
MFAGGGAIPLEALRLGCEAYALDLNPVAHIIELCTLVYPQKYGKPDATARGMAGPKNEKGETTWGGLADEMRYWGNFILKEVRTEIGDLYPLIPDPQYKGKKPSIQPRWFKEHNVDEVPLGHLMPVAYLWTRTVKCKNPACGAVVPLVRQTWLCKKAGRYVAMKMVAIYGKKRISFQIVEATTEKGLDFDPAAFSKAGNAACLYCGTVTDSDYLKLEGCAGSMGRQLMAVVCTRPGSQGKVYLSADEVPGVLPNDAGIRQRIETLCRDAGLTTPDEPLPQQGTLGFRLQPYGFRRWSDLFTERQMLCLLMFAKLIRQSDSAIANSGGDRCFVVPIITMLAALLDRLADFNSTGCTWNYTGGRGVLHTMARQALPMTWDFAETNPFNPDAASWISGLSDVPEAFSDLTGIASPGIVMRGSATEIPLADASIDAVVTDPPYYDNVPYADISDFFYVWLKRTVGHLYRDHLSGPLTPKKAEAIAEPMRHAGSLDKAKRAYENMMAKSFSDAHRVLKPGGAITIVYAHKTTLGWATLVDALRSAGFIVTEAWPLQTERAGRLRAMDSAALSSSIFLVARKRDGAATTGSYETHVVPELSSIVRERVETLWEMGISGADLVIACVGAGLRAFTKYTRVEYGNGEEVAAERFLAEVETAVLETVLGKLSKTVGTKNGQTTLAGLDPATRFYVLWRYTYGAAELDAGEAIIFANGTHVELDGQHSLTQGNRALLEKKKSKYRLHDYTERGDENALGQPAEDGASAPTVDALHRLLWLLEHKPLKVPQFLNEAKPNVEQLRLVAQALGGPALSGGELSDVSSTAEQAALGKLLANWNAAMVGKAAVEDRRTGQDRLFKE